MTKNYISEPYGLTLEQALLVKHLTEAYVKTHKGVFSNNPNVRAVSRYAYRKYFQECIDFAKEECPINEN